MGCPTQPFTNKKLSASLYNVFSQPMNLPSKPYRSRRCQRYS
ncbi:unnamed protein product [Staurois parvus]|uniref:Uncharacterized protein n=1 Tax=Staurois parvus TaxID=386267 RepID=A0ABN9FXC5_9NEOB|nr:unnamed protein product [Staurois parvus]